GDDVRRAEGGEGSAAAAGRPNRGDERHHHELQAGQCTCGRADDDVEIPPAFERRGGFRHVGSSRLATPCQPPESYGFRSSVISFMVSRNPSLANSRCAPSLPVLLRNTTCGIPFDEIQTTDPRINFS